MHFNGKLVVAIYSAYIEVVPPYEITLSSVKRGIFNKVHLLYRTVTHSNADEARGVGPCLQCSDNEFAKPSDINFER